MTTQDERDLAKMDAEIARLKREGYERGVNDAMAAAARDCWCGLDGECPHAVAAIRALLSKPTIEAPGDGYPATNGEMRPEAEATATCGHSRKVVLGACFDCGAQVAPPSESRATAPVRCKPCDGGGVLKNGDTCPDCIGCGYALGQPAFASRATAERPNPVREALVSAGLAYTKPDAPLAARGPLSPGLGDRLTEVVRGAAERAGEACGSRDPHGDRVCDLPRGHDGLHSMARVCTNCGLPNHHASVCPSCTSCGGSGEERGGGECFPCGGSGRAGA